MNFSLLMATYGIVFVTELLGDKSIYTVSSLTTRFRLAPVFCGIALAFMAKMLVAVLMGNVIAELPPALVTGISAATFFITALLLWLRKPKGERSERDSKQLWPQATAISFAAIFFSEWCDIGQITAATLTARYQAPTVVWLGATLALLTKGVLAMTLGLGLRRYIPANALRYGAVILCLTMGVLAALRVD
jgi:putative Ca2+/H+ antiporter (TMEM165/GDT1 family)